MSKETILLCDDEESFCNKWLETLQELKQVTERFELEILEYEELIKELNVLKERQKILRSEKTPEQNPSKLDKTSILIIDYDLEKLPGLESLITGENIAYYVRCFSECEMIIELNQYGPNPFDLSLRGHPESFADLNIGNEQLNNPGLWGGKTKEFRPWHWPHIPDYLDNSRKRTDDVKNNFETSIFDFIGIPEEIVGMMPRSATEFIGEDPQKTTFKNFLLESENALAQKDKKIVQNGYISILAKIAAARISKWLERMVFPGQNILVDAPHLVQRYPSLLKESHSNIETWDRTVEFCSYDKLGLDHEIIEDYRFKKEHWLSRPAWFWYYVSDCQRIKEVSDPWTREDIEYVFCEDSSRFHNEDECEEFLVKLDSPYVRRFARIFPDVHYDPKVRLFL